VIAIFTQVIGTKDTKRMATTKVITKIDKEATLAYILRN
jgi:hypothetical protein